MNKMIVRKKCMMISITSLVKIISNSGQNIFYLVLFQTIPKSSADLNRSHKDSGLTKNT